MTAPPRSPLAVEGEFPDDETLLADIIGVGLHAAGLIAAPEYVDTDTSAFPPPCVACYAPPGRSSINRLGDLKTAFLYVDCIAGEGRRDEAKAMGDAVQKLLLPYRHGGLWKTVQIRRIEQVTSPTELPLRHAEDPRHRESGWTVTLNVHRSPTTHP